ncbi:LOW QUALITY PROTEIN: hypothetical protein U9M48_013890 [Paspalum notatum var. saurae]|uniref:Reverse transcriptase domain-containing protein n=1 Tax=Paspalum notatum var. saurae TaxID=547442 RepID=A0AAQ3WK00_PASNO
MEAGLRHALIITCIGGAGTTSVESVSALLARSFGLAADSLVLRRASANEFILILPDEATAARVYDGGRPVISSSLRLHVARWTRFYRSTGVALCHELDVRRGKKQQAGTLPRRSRRLAGAGPCSPGPVVNPFQKRVMRSLGFGSEKKIVPMMQDEYCKLFEHELSLSNLAALTALFGWAASDDAQEGQNWWFTGVYGPQLDSEKLLFLQELRDIRALCSGPWLVAGDFNLIYQAADKNNTNLDRAMMGRFRRLLDDLEIKEIPLFGRKYTWSNERSSPTREIPGFLDAVQQNWEAPVASACPVERLFLKLQRLSRGLQKWSQRKVGNIKMQLGMAKEVIHRLEIARDSRALSEGEEQLRKKLKLHCLDLASLERTVARLRARILYLREGDANTSFHQQARYRKKKNFIAKLQVEDRVVVSQEEKQEVVLNFYENLIGKAEDREYTLRLSELGVLQHDLSSLDAPFTEEEVWATIKDLPMGKSPGPDGFTGRFFRVCWSIIKRDILLALAAIHGGHVSRFRLLNTAFITLLPKKVDAIQVKEFRPISLIHSVAKLVTKVLIGPPAAHFGSCKSECVRPGRNIHDNFLFVQQMVKSLYAKKEAHILLKLDISKAFDSVSWSFLLEVLQQRGFGQRWRNLMCLLLSTSSTQILVNGQPGDNIYHHRGLRQRDPLSPMLFILVMDVLNSMVQFATEKGLLQPLAVQQVRHRVSFYADDAVVFLRPANQDLQVVKFFLDYFGHASGLRTNLTKSSASPIHCSAEALALTTEALSCAIKEFPCTYLGLPLGVRKPTKAMLLPLIDKVADYLPGWKACLMNRAGRLVMVRAVLTATTIHHLIALDLPKWVIKAIDKLRRGFLWKGREKANGGNCLVSWDRVQRPLELGGLGIHNLEVLGWALRIRWLWSQRTDPDRLWGGLHVSVPAKAKAMFEVAVRTVVGDGNTTKFWTDRWIDGKCIADLAPALFAAVQKRAIKCRTVAQGLHNRSWVMDVRGALSVQVLTEYLLVWDLVDDTVLQLDVPDKHLWKLTQSGVYSSKSAYSAFFLGSVGLSGWKRIWKGWAPLKCKVFLWLAKNNRCWTSDRLAKRGLPHPSACPFCDQSDETIQHILLGCPFLATNLDQHPLLPEFCLSSALAYGYTLLRLGKRNPQAADPSVDHAKNPHFLVLLSENFMEARTALSRPLHGNLAPNQTITKMDTAPAVTMSGPTSNANSSVNGPMIGRQSVGVGGISTATVKVEPATIPPMVSAPTFSHITPISNMASQGISALQTSSPSLISQEANVANDSVQEHKPIINPVQQPVRPGGHGSLLNNLSQVRLMNSTSLRGGATSMGLPNIGTTPIQVHMSNMISSGMTSTPSVISSMSGPGQPIAAQQMVQSTALGSFGSNTSTVSGNSNEAVSSSLPNIQSSMGMGQSVQPVAQGGLMAGSQLGQGGIGANQNVMGGLGSTAISSAPAMMPTPGMARQTGVNSIGVTNNSAMNMPIGQHPNGQQAPPKYVKIWEGTLSGQRQGQPVFICKLEGYRSGTTSETAPLRLKTQNLVDLQFPCDGRWMLCSNAGCPPRSLSKSARPAHASLWPYPFVSTDRRWKPAPVLFSFPRRPPRPAVGAAPARGRHLPAPPTAPAQPAADTSLPCATLRRSALGSAPAWRLATTGIRRPSRQAAALPQCRRQPHPVLLLPATERPTRLLSHPAQPMAPPIWGLGGWEPSHRAAALGCAPTPDNPSRRLPVLPRCQSAVRLAADWPETMQIVRLIAQEHMNNKQYVGKADFLVFRTLNQHGFLGQLQEKKLISINSATTNAAAAAAAAAAATATTVTAAARPSTSAAADATPATAAVADAADATTAVADAADATTAVADAADATPAVADAADATAADTDAADAAAAIDVAAAAAAPDAADAASAAAADATDATSPAAASADATNAKPATPAATADATDATPPAADATPAADANAASTATDAANAAPAAAPDGGHRNGAAVHAGPQSGSEDDAREDCAAGARQHAWGRLPILKHIVSAGHHQMTKDVTLYRP